MNAPVFAAPQRRVIRDAVPPSPYEMPVVPPRPRILRGRSTPAAALFDEDAPDLQPDFPLSVPAPEHAVAPHPPPVPEEALDLEALRAEWQAEWEASARTEHDTALRRAKSEAFQKGYASARAELLPEIERLEAVLADELPKLKTACLAQFDHLTPRLVELAVAFAETLIGEAVPDDLKALSGRALADALERFGDTAPLDVTLHPVDLMRLQEQGLVEQLETTFPQLRWHTDAALQQGDWSAQTPDTALRWLRDEQRDRLRHHLGLAAAEDEKAITSDLPLTDEPLHSEDSEQRIEDRD